MKEEYDRILIYLYTYTIKNQKIMSLKDKYWYKDTELSWFEQLMINVSELTFYLRV